MFTWSLYVIFTVIYVTQAQNTECDDVFLVDSGSISSPGYPNGYDVNLNCTYILTVEPPNHVFLEFSDLNIGNNTDFVKIYSLRDIYGLEPALIASLTGYLNSTQLINTTFTSDLSEMMVVFQSGGQQLVKSGFQASFSTAENECGGYYYNLTYARYINVPSTNQVYNGIKTCSWIAAVQGEYLAAVRFYSPSLSWNSFVRIYSIETAYDGTERLTLMNTGNPEDRELFVSSTERLAIHFESSNSATTDTFQAYLSRKFGDCGGEYDTNSKNNTITSPNYPIFYDNNMWCNYTIKADDGNVVNLEILDFNLEKNYDFLTIYNGDGTLLEKLTGNTNIPNNLMSTTNVVTMIFNSDSSGQKGGFSLEYTRAKYVAPTEASPENFDASKDAEGSKENIVSIINVLTNYTKYNKRVRPVQKSKHVLNVTMDIKMRSMLEIDENDQTMTSMIQVKLSWTDLFFKWDQNKQFKDQVEELQMKQEDMWTPDVTIDNIVEANFHLGDKRNNLDVNSDGTVTWLISTLVTTQCDILVRYYPFDLQICDLIFTTEQSKQNRIVLETLNELTEDFESDAHGSDSSLGLYGADGTWEMLGYSIQTGDTIQNKSTITYSYYMRRRSAFYIITFIIPVIMLSMTSCLVFLIPTEAGEKMGTSITVVLAYAVYLTMVSEYLPDTSLEVSYLALYLTALLGLTTLSSVITAISLHIYYLPKEKKIGKNLATVFLCLRRCFCFRRKEKFYHKKSLKRQAKELQKIAALNLEGLEVIQAEPEEDDLELTWVDIAGICDWAFYIVFSLLCLSMSVIYISLMITEGLLKDPQPRQEGVSYYKYKDSF